MKLYPEKFGIMASLPLPEAEKIYMENPKNLKDIRQYDKTVKIRYS